MQALCGFSSAKQSLAHGFQRGLLCRRELPLCVMLGVHRTMAEAQSEYLGQTTTEVHLGTGQQSMEIPG